MIPFLGIRKQSRARGGRLASPPSMAWPELRPTEHVPRATATLTKKWGLGGKGRTVGTVAASFCSLAARWLVKGSLDNLPSSLARATRPGLVGTRDEAQPAQAILPWLAGGGGGP